MLPDKSDDLSVDVSTEKSLKNKTADHKASPDAKKPSTISNGPVPGKRPTVWGRTSAKKNLSMESIDYPIEDDVEIQKLEASKIELQNRIFEEIKGNAILQAKLEKRKKALHEHRQALQQDVARLQKQLQKERDKRKVLEAELNTSKGPLQVPVTIDENIKADLEEITQADANVANLKWKVNDLGAQLNQQHEQHSVSMHGLINQPMNALIHEAKWNDEQKDAEATGTSQFRRPASKDTCMDGTETQQLDSAHSGNSRPVSSTNFKRSSTRSEGVNSTTSALTRLTSRLNFLKERRSQIANEIQNMDKGRGSDQNLEKSQGSETPSFQNLEKDKGLGKEGKPLQNSEKSTTSDVQSLQDRDGGQYSEGVRPQSLLSEKSYNAGKGQPLVPQRINSR